MTRNEQIALAVGAAAVAAYVIWQNSQYAKGARPVQGAVEGVTWKAGYPVGHDHLALPWEIGATLWGPHPIYCDRDGPGKYRDPLIAQGWSWIADNPSNETI
jgi:hypothetical protein